jgi:hypothetical protein
VVDDNKIMENKTMDTDDIKKESVPPFKEIGLKQLRKSLTGLTKVSILAVLAIVLTVGVIMGTQHSSKAFSALTSKCTLSILNGTVEVTVPGTTRTEPGTDGMTLEVGYRVKTSPESTALLTFFDGSTLKLEQGTDVEIEQLELGEDQKSINIVLKQWMGETWSHVVKMANHAYHYEIQTPSAVALVRGTRFLTKVDPVGATEVLTTEGLVSVSAQGEEIFLPVGKQTAVAPGAPPSEPEPVDISEYTSLQEQEVQQEEESFISLHPLSQVLTGNIPVGLSNWSLSTGSNLPIAKSQEVVGGQGNGESQGNTKNHDNDNGNALKETAKAEEKAAQAEAKELKEQAKAEEKAAKVEAKELKEQDTGQGFGFGQGNSFGLGNSFGQGNSNGNAGNQPTAGNPAQDTGQGFGFGQGNSFGKGNNFGQGNSNGNAGNQPTAGSPAQDTGQGFGQSSGFGQGNSNGNTGNQPTAGSPAQDTGQGFGQSSGFGQGNSNGNTGNQPTAGSPAQDTGQGLGFGQGNSFGQGRP